MKTTDGGISWNKVSNVSVNYMTFTNANTGYARIDGEFKKTTDGGVS